MAFLIRNIIEYNLLDGATIIAGHKGSHNEILWINLMEILDALDSLQKGELLITTGYGLDNEKLYRDIILRLKSKGLAGLAVQTGYYISKIPDYIVKAAEEYDFPVIDLPQNLTFSYITRTLIDNINLQFDLSSDSDLIILQNKLQNILKDETNETHKILSLETNYPFHMFLLSASANHGNIVSKQASVKTMEKLTAYFSNVTHHMKIELSNKKILYIISLNENIQLQDVYFDISSIIDTLSKEFSINLLVGISTVSNIKNLISSFNDAMSSQQMLKKFGNKKGVCSFSDLELFKLFEILGHSDFSMKFAYDTLSPLLDFDKTHNSKYLDTLKLYLFNSCNITETSKKLFIHRHTLKNRLNKIAELCDIKLDNHFSRLRFSMAIFIHEYFLQNT